MDQLSDIPLSLPSHSLAVKLVALGGAVAAVAYLKKRREDKSKLPLPPGPPNIVGDATGDDFGETSGVGKILCACALAQDLDTDVAA